ncbi:immunoglobulin iota chain [Macaca fascicularis]|uniref:immunoglobulin iota chain n=1 Tax=Macaca fascicularis TaxID=9541 RepID=UPI0003AB6A95|nr:PREDICTED: immunoglobulin iota chain [Macaca fascicularis]
MARSEPQMLPPRCSSNRRKSRMVVARTRCATAPPLRAGRRILRQPLGTPGTVATEVRALRVCTMSWAPVLLMLLVYCTGCGPQPVLHQPPAMSSALGTTIRLTCTLRNDHDISVYSVYWYQQRPGHPPRFLLRYFSQSDKSQGPQVPPRFSGSKDVAGNKGYLNIAELQPEDEAMYYCAMGARSFEKKEREREWEEEMEPTAAGTPVP